MLDADQGVGARPDQGDRARGPRRDGGADHLRRGPRSDRGPPGRRLQGVPGLGITGGDRDAAGRAPGGGRRHRQPAGGRRGGPLHRGDGVLRLRPVQGRGHARNWPARRDSTSSESSAYSDSYTDLPMLEAVGHPVAVNPDRVLAKAGPTRDWEVMQFTKPVRLRDRVSVPSLVDDRRRGRCHRRRHCGRAGRLAAGPTAARSRRQARTLSGGPSCSVRRRVASARVAQEGRSRLAATTPRATMMARIRSFFMSRDA